MRILIVYVCMIAMKRVELGVTSLYLKLNYGVKV